MWQTLEETWNSKSFLDRISAVLCSIDIFLPDGGFGGGEGMDDEDLVGKPEEGGGWDVGDEDLELPADLVRSSLQD